MKIVAYKAGDDRFRQVKGDLTDTPLKERMIHKLTRGLVRDVNTFQNTSGVYKGGKDRVTRITVTFHHDDLDVQDLVVKMDQNLQDVV